MSYQNCWKKLLPFGLTLTLGFFAVYVNQGKNKDQKIERENAYVITGVKSKEIPKFALPENSNLLITFKPRASYTDSARSKEIQGTVTLKVTFLANGEIGKIRVVAGLPNGLSEQAIAAAKNMRFEPAKKNNIPYTVTKQLQYNFTIY